MTLSMDRPDQSRAAKRARPYTLTAGRTRPRIDLGVEATVEAVATAETSWGQADIRTAIVDLCDERLSIAEISSHAGVPIGVTRGCWSRISSRAATCG